MPIAIVIANVQNEVIARARELNASFVGKPVPEEAMQGCNRDAIDLLAATQPDVVKVDYNLRDGPCLPLVAKLVEMSIPYLIASGYGAPPDVELEGAPWLVKPFSPDGLLRRLRALVSVSEQNPAAT
jgi:DNA-binding response OmpR family regulator